MNDWFVTPPPVDLGQLDWVTKHHASAHRQRFLALAAHPEPREGGVLFRLTLDDPAMRALGWRVGDELAMAVAHGWVAVRRLPPHQGGYVLTSATTGKKNAELVGTHTAAVARIKDLPTVPPFPATAYQADQVVIHDGLLFVPLPKAWWDANA